MEGYCGSAFWDPGISWNTTSPDLTPCFEKTALLWPVCLFLWLQGIYQICASQRTFSPSDTGFLGAPSWSPGFTWLTFVKLFNVSVLSLLQIALLCLNLYVHWDDEQYGTVFGLPPFWWLTPLINVATHILSGFLILIHKSRCVHTSGTQLVYWLLLSIVHILEFQTDIRAYQPHLPFSSAIFASIVLQGVTLALSIYQTLLFCWSDIPKPISNDTDSNNYSQLRDPVEKECPILRCSSLSYILFSWCTPLIRQGAKTPLTTNDLWSLVPVCKSAHVFLEFSKNFSQRHHGELRGIFRNIINPVWKTCGKDFTLGIVFKTCGTLLSFLAPKLMGILIDFVEDKEIETWKGYLCTVSLLLLFIAITLLSEQFLLYTYKVYMNIFSSLNLLIYRKSLGLSSQARQKKTVGEIVNLMMVDVGKIRTTIYYSGNVISSPIVIIVGVYLLWRELGYSFLPGIAILITIIPANWYLASKQRQYQAAQMKQKDIRIKVISEVLGAMQVVKLYAWEPSFMQQIQQIRKQEVALLRNRAIYEGGTTFLMESVPFLVSAASFFTFVYVSGGELDAKKAFTTLALFNLLNEPITDFPSSISGIVDTMVSLKRLNEFLNAEELQPDATAFLPKSESKEELALEIVNGTFAWEEMPEGETSSGATLQNINLSVKCGSLTAIVGSVGAGKSSLLSAMLGDMRKLDGQVTIWGKVAYVSQIAWIMNASLRENILFGKPYNEEMYRKVVECCCLEPDIEMLPAGDMTEIGEKGINLSGGQKQRVSLARAVYSGADILLLDDVLSAVDSHVGKDIFNKLLGPSGLRREKTRILCTHSYQFLSQVDQIVMMEQGKVVEKGTYLQLMKRSGAFNEMVVNHIQSNSTEMQNLEITNDTNSPSKLATTTTKKPTDSNEGQLIEEESLETGNVKLSVFLEYSRAMGWPLMITFLLMFAVSEGLTLGRDIVLTQWTTSTTNATTRYVVKYSSLGVSQCFCFIMAYLFLAFGSLQAAQLLHNNMLQRIFKAPMRFFNITPLGRITNRFSSDVDTMDNDLWASMADWIAHVYQIFVIIIAIIFASKVYFLACIIPMGLICYFLQRNYILSMQQLERLRSKAKSPIHALFQESLNGTSTIRAYKAQNRFMRLLGEKVDRFNQIEMPHQVVRRWLSTRLGLLGSLVVFVPALFAVIWRDSIEPGMVGLSISYAMKLTAVLSWLIKVTSYLQYSFVSVERVLQYCKVDQEADFEVGRRECPENWPRKGNISFENYGTRYGPGLDLVLREFSCRMRGGEKIGIVGRTGAGKSSLTLALFRIVEAVEGGIWIDGVNIGRLGLQQLRKRISVIPQDPVLFSRSLRLNLDPFGEHEDGRIWEVLEMVHLKDFVNKLGQGLEYMVAEGGENLSVGERQLVCVARSLLRKSAILVMDEATASVDSATDELIQKTIREQFANCTIVNVAHRLNTVLDSSRILVLDKGSTIEFDTPENLLADPDSHFYGMARDAGIV